MAFTNMLVLKEFSILRVTMVDYIPSISNKQGRGRAFMLIKWQIDTRLASGKTRRGILSVPFQMSYFIIYNSYFNTAINFDLQ